MAREEEEKRHLSLVLKDARDLEGHSALDKWAFSHKHQLLLKSSLHWNKKPFCFPTQRCYDLMAAAAGCRLHHFRRNWKFWIVFCRQIFLLNATIFQGFKVFIFKPWFIHAFSISSSPKEHYLSGHYLNVFFGNVIKGQTEYRDQGSHSYEKLLLGWNSVIQTVRSNSIYIYGNWADKKYFLERRLSLQNLQVLPDQLENEKRC